MDRQIDAIADHGDSVIHTPRNAASKITASQRERYQRDGFLVLEQVIDLAAIDEIRQAISTMIASYSLAGESIFETCIRLNREHDQALHNVYKVSHQTAAMNRLRERCGELVRSLIPQDSGVLIDVDSHIIFCIPDSTRLTWGWHQESAYDVFDGKGVNFCLPIFERATQENGSMSVLSGSHTKGKLPFIKMKRHENGATTLVPQGIEALEREFSEVFFEADPGDLVMFDRHLIHRSNSNRSPRPRVTAVIRFMQIETLPASFDKPY